MRQNSNLAPIVRIDGLRKSFGEVAALDDVSLEIKAGEFFALLGASGCGKTSLLRIIAGFEAPDRGRVFIAGKDMTDLPPHLRPVNMMFQSYALFPHMNVEQNIAFGLVQQGLPKYEIAARVAEMLRLVQLGGLNKRRPDQLSGGQRQRVALARALARRPAILLLDEPLAALDKNLREETQMELVALQAQLATTFVIVTHDQREAIVLSHRLAVMRAGRFEQIGSPTEIYAYPASRYVAEFVGEINLLDGHVVDSVGDKHKIATQAGVATVMARQSYAPATPVTLALRPERLRLAMAEPQAQSANQFFGQITGRSYRGEATVFEVAVGEVQRLRVLQQNFAAQGDDLAIGAKVCVSFTDDAGIVLAS